MKCTHTHTHTHTHTCMHTYTLAHTHTHMHTHTHTHVQHAYNYLAYVSGSNLVHTYTVHCIPWQSTNVFWQYTIVHKHILTVHYSPQTYSDSTLCTLTTHYTTHPGSSAHRHCVTPQSTRVCSASTVSQCTVSETANWISHCAKLLGGSGCQ